MDEGKFSVASKDGVVEYDNLDELSLLSFFLLSPTFGLEVATTISMYFCF